MRWDEVLAGATAVASTLGGFGNEEQMKKINGEANILAVNAAKDYGKKKYHNGFILQENFLFLI